VDAAAEPRPAADGAADDEDGGPGAAGASRPDEAGTPGSAGRAPAPAPGSADRGAPAAGPGPGGGGDAGGKKKGRRGAGAKAGADAVTSVHEAEHTVELARPRPPSRAHRRAWLSHERTCTEAHRNQAIMQAELPAMRASVNSSQAGQSDRKGGEAAVRGAVAGGGPGRAARADAGAAERAAADALLRATPGAPNPRGWRRRGRGSHKRSLAAWLASGAGADSVQCFLGGRLSLRRLAVTLHAVQQCVSPFVCPVDCTGWHGTVHVWGCLAERRAWRLT